ncbi:DUF3617 domain-containing protein [Altericroceibacterium endophyticum]|uniref:DUF3617 family protein n=1 Tax=Altericroceibacterium endophyticum TaxID=1808508 RepID=A0A6I4T4Z0_9SPHN|nr:DUF3617 domain-containing protein [Altericroceibacterium endophyticum]MXO64980.1 DUF3617 family protein [Altericroceibacterium endophyticum]
MLKTLAILPLGAALMLAACSSEPEEGDGPVSQEDVARQAENLIHPAPGEYKTSMEMMDFEIPGMPDAQAKQLQSVFEEASGMKNSFCLTPEEADKGFEGFLEEIAEGDCTFNSFNASDDKISADMTCNDVQGTSGNVKFDGTMREDGSTLVMELRQKVPGMPDESQVFMKMKMESERLGDCS